MKLVELRKTHAADWYSECLSTKSVCPHEKVTSVSNIISLVHIAELLLASSWCLNNSNSSKREACFSSSLLETQLYFGYLQSMISL